MKYSAYKNGLSINEEHEEKQDSGNEEARLNRNEGGGSREKKLSSNIATTSYLCLKKQ